ncbi:hypothetical protein CASFOL_030595 [Castilleja foliolosa]|uniref:Uncharacterized protein n=1 Tax=Castilleja foliolosa TaxID=1961234 RepID=A0ABD3C737_9LAMI
MILLLPSLKSSPTFQIHTHNPNSDFRSLLRPNWRTTSSPPPESLVSDDSSSYHSVAAFSCGLTCVLLCVGFSSGQEIGFDGVFAMGMVLVVVQIHGGDGEGDFPERCVASVLLYLDLPQICRMAMMNRAFRGAGAK